jgi:hypothetical protein
MEPIAHVVWTGCGLRRCSASSASRRVGGVPALHDALEARWPLALAVALEPFPAAQVESTGTVADFGIFQPEPEKGQKPAIACLFFNLTVPMRPPAVSADREDIKQPPEPGMRVDQLRSGTLAKTEQVTEIVG